MEGKDIGGGGGGGDGLVDRSKVRILLCDNDSKSSQEVFSLLLKCSYQVTSVRSARQVIDALNAEGADIDIILAEVDLPMRKGMKMLKYITRDKDLIRIPVIMMSAKDEVSIVVKCLRLGAADYLVKPLRTNELLNLWTHMWRRRRMLGLAEKNMLYCDFDLVASDPSDANTNSTTLFSDDTDDKSRKNTILEMGISNNPEEEHAVTAAAAAVELCPHDPDVPGITDCRTRHVSSPLKKTKLKIGESSAFFTYIKSSAGRKTSHVINQIKENNTSHNPRTEDNRVGQQLNVDSMVHEEGQVWESYSQGDDLRSSTSFPDSFSLDRSCTPPSSRDHNQRGNFNEGNNLSSVLMHGRNESQVDGTGFVTHSVFPYYPSGVMNQVMMPSAAHLYQKHLHGLQNQANSMIPQYSHLPQGHSGITGLASFSYYPVNISLQPGQMPGNHQWSQVSSGGGGGASSNDATPSKVDRREAALIKFRQKRKERCFDKKIRYVNRKKLAERRPRVRGQFVRKVNGVNVDLNGQPTPTDYEDDEEDEEDEHASRDSSPEDEG